jgi:hypothetical protein
VNEPAGNLAKIIVIHTVKLVVHAWDNAGDDVRNVTETVLQCLFHPDFHNPQSQIQKEMVRFYNPRLDFLLTLHYSHPSSYNSCVNGFTSTLLEVTTWSSVSPRTGFGTIITSGRLEMPALLPSTLTRMEWERELVTVKVKVKATVNKLLLRFRRPFSKSSIFCESFCQPNFDDHRNVPGVSQFQHGMGQVHGFINSMPSVHPGREMPGEHPGGGDHPAGPGHDDYLPTDPGHDDYLPADSFSRDTPSPSMPAQPGPSGECFCFPNSGC